MKSLELFPACTMFDYINFGRSSKGGSCCIDEVLKKAYIISIYYYDVQGRPSGLKSRGAELGGAENFGVY